MAKSCLPVAVLAGTMVLGAGCGGEDSVASQSARAFREAQARGDSVASDGHGHEHGAASPTTAGAAPSVEHADREPAAAAPTHVAAETQSTATDRAAADDATAGTARHDDLHAHPAPVSHTGGAQHGATPSGPARQARARPDDQAHARHGGGTPAPTPTPRATATVDHAAMGHGAAGGVHAPPSLAAIESQTALPPATPVPPGAPAKTLAPDALDAPAYEPAPSPTPPHANHPGGTALDRRQP